MHLSVREKCERSRALVFFSTDSARLLPASLLPSHSEDLLWGAIASIWAPNFDLPQLCSRSESLVHLSRRRSIVSNTVAGFQPLASGAYRCLKIGLSQEACRCHGTPGPDQP